MRLFLSTFIEVGKPGTLDRAPMLLIIFMGIFTYMFVTRQVFAECWVIMPGNLVCSGQFIEKLHAGRMQWRWARKNPSLIHILKSCSTISMSISFE